MPGVSDSLAQIALELLAVLPSLLEVRNQFSRSKLPSSG
jgi:hypothetical protein